MVLWCEALKISPKNFKLISAESSFSMLEKNVAKIHSTLKKKRVLRALKLILLLILCNVRHYRKVQKVHWGEKGNVL